LVILKKMSGFHDYGRQRDFPGVNGTTGLSAHVKFGTISAREFYHAVSDSLGQEHILINQLYWRDFFTQIGYHYPKVLGAAFQDKYARVAWSIDPADFTAWSEGRTGFPIVDAGMRELNATGFMHNRSRMITASFLVKDLHIDWRMGERYFAQKLVDYDPLVNNGNWQWAASTGCDAQPYFRIFNPWLQQVKFDPAAVYIKKWIPELRNFPAEAIHALGKHPSVSLDGYPRPMVDHHLAKEETKSLFRRG
jgi:deoxyribodipyrimidine photo-lyase